MKGLLVLVLFCGVSCSFNSAKSQADYEAPKMVFENALITRYEKNKKLFFVTADLLEGYSSKDVFAVKNINITQYGTAASTGMLVTELVASAEQALLVQKKEQYFLAGQVKIDSKKEKIQLFANNLYYNGENNLLLSGEGEAVELKREDGTHIKGKSFIANAVSWEFEFKDSVEGYTADEKASENPAKAHSSPADTTNHTNEE